ncbi:MAG: sigma 54-interacting transcriptional regulator [Candidatus Eisenbacteria bacterium]|nr:sigma 54-interacting transcriptional regulator [Candidatus Eisenbacteria bacterium]
MNPLLRAALQQVREAAPTDQPILIQGETGTGKELVARAVHDLSRRARGPYVPVNCGALSPEMLDSEVFGHQKGRSPGDHRARWAGPHRLRRHAVPR